MMMIIKILKNLLVLFSVLVIQVSIVPNIPALSGILNFALVVIIFMAVSYDYNVGIIYAVIIGLVLEMYSTLPYGFILLALIGTLVMVNFVSTRILTNKSFYSLVGQILLATLFYGIIIFLYKVIYTSGASQVFVAIEQQGLKSIYNLLWRVVANIMTVTIIFFLFHFSSKRFKAVYIDTTKA